MPTATKCLLLCFIIRAKLQVMVKGRVPDGWGDSDAPRVRPLRRVINAFFGLGPNVEKAPLGERLRSTFLKPAEPGSTVVLAEPQSVEELEAAIKSSSDKERLVGLIAAPWAGGIGIVVVNALISRDPASLLANGQVNKLHVSVSLYHEVLIALLVLAAMMLVTALLRKRLYLGIVMALYGLTLFNLHYWGFAIPFILFGSWLMVRAYRLQRSLREAGGGTLKSRTHGGDLTYAGRPRANKRYTPPTSPPRH